MKKLSPYEPKYPTVNHVLLYASIKKLLAVLTFALLTPLLSQAQTPFP